MTADFSIAGRPIGAGQPVYVIAELSANHRQHEDVAVQLVHAAHEAGADAVKLQTYTPDTITIDSDAESFRAGSGSLWEGTTLHDLYQEAYMPWDWQPRLKTLAESLGMDCFSSPFDPTAVDFLAALDVPAFKVASFELVDLPLIRRMAATGKPLVISTGMGTEAEIDEAVAAARSAGATEIALLKCTSAYPSPPEAVNLRAIAAMRDRWGVPIGLSDHTLGETVAIGAVALGACIVEKHMRLSSEDTSPDFGVLAGQARIPPDGRRHPRHRAGARGAGHRPDRGGAGEPALPAIAVRGRRRGGGRDADRGQRPVDPTGRRAPHPPL